MTWGTNLIFTKTINNVSTQVTIGLTKDTENLTNAIFSLTPPTAIAGYSAGKKDTKILDLLRIEERYSFQGHLATALGSGDTSTNASDKKTDLKNIFKSGGTITMTYEGQSIVGIMDKLEISREKFDGSEPASGEVGFDVQLSFIKGVNMVGGN